jgi:hypothetical protein
MAEANSGSAVLTISFDSAACQIGSGDAAVAAQPLAETGADPQKDACRLLKACSVHFHFPCFGLIVRVFLPP